MPTISVVMFVYNAARTIERALASVTADQPPVEILVMDGGSTDGTVDVIRRYATRIAFWRSHSDAGPIAAMNEGISKATGDIICLLPADDWVEPGGLYLVQQAFGADEELDVVSCGTRFVRCEADGTERVEDEIIEPGRLEFKIANIVRCPMTAGHFVTRRMYNRLGGYDASYRMSNDLDFLIRACLARPKAAIVPRLVYTYRSHPGSRTLGNSSEMLFEMMRDNLRIVAMHLRKSAMQPEERRELTGMHGRNAGRFAWMLAARGDVAGAFAIFREAIQFNGWWPVQVWYWIACRLLRPLSRP